jgi:hypothetical protein
VLRTFATANGDAERAAKMLGMSAEDVRRELRAMLDGGSSGIEDSGRAVRLPPVATAAAAEAPKAKTVKKK